MFSQRRLHLFPDQSTCIFFIWKPSNPLCASVHEPPRAMPTSTWCCGCPQTRSSGPSVCQASQTFVSRHLTISIANLILFHWPFSRPLRSSVPGPSGTGQQARVSDLEEQVEAWLGATVEALTMRIGDDKLQIERLLADCVMCASLDSHYGVR